MNRVYKVIWSKAKHCYVVTSEIARSVTKSASSARSAGRKGAAVLAMAALLFTAGGVLGEAATANVTDVSGSIEAQNLIIVTKDDGTSKNFAINNVEKAKEAVHATAADRATKDGNGVVIDTNYVKNAAAEVDAGGTYVKVANTVGQNLSALDANLSALDEQVKKNTEAVVKVGKTAGENFTDLYAKVQTNADAVTAEENARKQADQNNLKVGDDGVISKVSNDGTTSTAVNKLVLKVDGDNQITMDKYGIKVGTNSGVMDKDGFYAGGDDYEHAGAALKWDGSIKGAGGKFTVEADGKVTAASGKIGNVDITSAGAVSGVTDLTVNGTFDSKTLSSTVVPDINYTTITGGKTQSMNWKMDAVTGETKSSASTFDENGSNAWAKDDDSIGKSSMTADKISQSLSDTGDHPKNEASRVLSQNTDSKYEIADSVVDENGNNNVSTQTASESSSVVSGKDGKNSYNSYITQNMKKILQKIEDGDGNVLTSTEQTETGIKSTATDGENNASTNLSNEGFNTFASDGTNKTYTKQTATDIKNTAEKGMISHTAKNLVNRAYENMTNTVDNDLTTTVGGEMKTTVTGKVTEDYKSDLDTTVGGNEIRTVEGTLKETVTGDVTEDYKANLNTTVGGEMNTTVTGNVTEDYKSDLDTTVGGNETRTVEGTLKETVTGNVTEDYKANLDTTVGGEMKTTVTGNVTEDYQSDLDTTVGGEMKTTVTGKVTEDYQSDLDTTVGGEMKTTVTGKVTEDYQSDLDTTVGGEMKTTVTGKVTEDYQSDLDTTVGGDSSLSAENIHNTATKALTNEAETITNKAHESVTTQIGEGTAVKSVMDVKGIANTATGRAITNDAQTITNTGIASVTNQVSDNKVLVDTNQVKSAFGDTIYTTWDAYGITNTAGNNTVISDNDGTTFANEDAKTPFEEGGKTGTRVNTKITGNKVETGKVLTDFAEVANNLDVKGSTTTGTLRVEKDGYVGGDLNVEGNIETHDAELSENSRQVVTGRQLYQTNERVDRLDNRIKKVGANAAALAALRPGDFNPDDKFSIAAGFGSYRNASAAALGLFYRPNENVLLSLGTSFGDGENMVNAGVSVKFGRGKSMAERRKEMADEVSSMRDEMRSQDERIAELEEMLKKQSELIEKLSKES